MNQSEWIAKPASAWRPEDLDELEQAEEGAYLELKKPSEFIISGSFSWDRFSEQVSETVSAFLNADGGVLLIGVQTDQRPGDKKIELLKRLKTWATDQTFEYMSVSLTASQVRDRIYSNILPRPFGVEVKSLDIKAGGVATTVFVVTVPSSTLGAHQSARTHRYYRRTADGDVPMLDYEIRDVNNRKAGPLLYLACAVARDGTIYAEDEWKTSNTQMNQVNIQGEPIYRIVLIFALTNLGRGTANIVRFDVGIPRPWQVHHYSPEGTNAGAYWVSNNELGYVVGNRVSVFWRPEKCRELPFSARQRKISEEAVGWQKVIYNGNEPPAHPLWPTADRVVVGVLGLQLQITGASKTWWWLPWRIFTEGMPETRGAVLLEVRSGQFRVVNYAIDDVSWAGELEDEKFTTLKERFQV